MSKMKAVGILVSVLLVLSAGYLSCYSVLCVDGSVTFLRRTLSGFLAVGCIGATVFIYKLQQMITSDYHTPRTMFDQYLAFAFMGLIGCYKRKKLEASTRKVSETQERILMQRLKYNAETEYGQEFQFSEIKSQEDFRKSHPLTRYGHYKAYINRIEKGEENIITKDRPINLSLTSGTSGNASILPTIKKQYSAFFLQGISICFDSLFKAFPGAKQLQKDLKFFYSPKPRTSESGIPVGPNSSSPASSKALLNLYTTPKAGFNIMTEPEALYIHLLFGLRDRKLGMIEANFSSIIYMGFVAMETQWQQLVEDVRLGRINPDLKIEDSTRKELNALLKPDAMRADELKVEFQKGFDGIVKRVWPLINLILTVDTGSFELYRQVLVSYYAKGVPIYSPLYAATEGLLGINIWPHDEKRYYLLVPESMFFEFIPIDESDEDQPDTLFLDQVEVGKTYEMVITNISGLYRYRFGDVIRVVRFHNQCPVVEFLYRQGQLLNVHGEKTSEDVLYKALVETASDWPNVKLVDYTCAESVMLNSRYGNSNASPSQFYLIFIELEGAGTNSHKLTQTQKNRLDECLQRRAFVYESFRSKGSIAEPRVLVVRNGAFKRLKDFLVEQTMASANQVKIPRVLKRHDTFKFMMENVIE